MIRAFGKACKRELPYEVVGRRTGDVLNLTADPRRAHDELDWRADRSLEEMCADLWRWTENNPLGYKQEPPQAFVDAFKGKGV